MKLVSFSAGDGKVHPGVLSGETVIDLSPAGYADTLAVITAGLASAPPGPTLPLKQVKLHAPLVNPPRVFGIGLNYRGHAAETNSPLPAAPVVFFKMQTAIIGLGETIVLPKNSTQPDYEAELAFVIGKGGFRISAAAWREHVYGYTIVNDVSAPSPISAMRAGGERMTRSAWAGQRRCRVRTSR